MWIQSAAVYGGIAEHIPKVLVNRRLPDVRRLILSTPNLNLNSH